MAVVEVFPDPAQQQPECQPAVGGVMAHQVKPPAMPVVLTLKLFGVDQI